ncbi:MAG: S8 family peptidase, partial [Anaerolineales bacterium]|nr:S8 family peptidase [Anaerolineales bacterium]
GITGARRLTRSYPITAYASKDTVIRLRVLANYGAAAESFVVDSVEISFWNKCHKCIDTARLTNSYVRAVGADRLWNEAPYLQGDGVTIAVLDSGIAEHLDLQGESWSGRILDHVDFTGAWFPDDTNGHGSHVAGVVGGDGYSSSGAYRGLAPRADLVDVRVTDDQGRGTTSGVVAGLQWVYDHRDFYNIRVVNLSLNSTAGGSYHTDPLNAAVEILWFNGIVVVTAAGNNGQSAAGQIFAPANDPFVITVGAVDDKGTPSLADDALAKFSAYGTTSDGFAKPDLVAPGKNIISLLAGEDSNLAQEHPANKVSSWAGNAYFKMSGTSVAAPMVAAAAAMLLEAQPGLTPDQVKYRLLATANKNWPGYSAAQAGAGYLDVYTAVHTATTASSNTGLTASQLLWTGGNPVTWGAVSWNSVSWNSVSWNSVSWNSVSWNSVSWNSDDWGP